jgi:SAM-dependent methyltransferase
VSDTVVINLGCGGRKAPDQIGVDRYPGSAADILADLERPLPFADNSAGRVVLEHVFEHLENPVGLMQEIHRILAPDGILEAEVPYFAHPDAFRDPTHRRYCTWGTFDYFVVGAKPAEYTPVCFRYLSRELLFSPGPRGFLGRLLVGLSPRRYEKYSARSFPARALRVSLIPVK